MIHSMITWYLYIFHHSVKNRSKKDPLHQKAVFSNRDRVTPIRSAHSLTRPENLPILRAKQCIHIINPTFHAALQHRSQPYMISTV